MASRWMVMAGLPFLRTESSLHASLSQSARARSLPTKVANASAAAEKMSLMLTLIMTASPHSCAFYLFVRSGSRRPPQVLVMQSTDARHLHHPALAPHLHTPRLGCVLSQR